MPYDVNSCLRYYHAAFSRAASERKLAECEQGSLDSGHLFVMGRSLVRGERSTLVSLEPWQDAEKSPNQKTLELFWTSLSVETP
jgi:hypothetical protein